MCTGCTVYKKWRLVIDYKDSKHFLKYLEVNMIEDLCENYFNSLNSLAARIGGDVKTIRSAYEGLWYTLSTKEQDQIINDNIIDPKIHLKYSDASKSLIIRETCVIRTGEKVIVDDSTGTSWPDEHSSPFSWKTKSQLELCKNSKCVPEYSTSDIFIQRKHSDLIVAPLSTSTDVPDAAAPVSKFSVIYTRLKSLPVITFGTSEAKSSNDACLFSKFKHSAVNKVHNTFRFVTEKLGNLRGGEGDALVSGDGVVIVPQNSKPSPKISKPTCPPPPPPPKVQPRPDEADTPLLTATTPVLSHDIARAPVAELVEDGVDDEFSDAEDSAKFVECQETVDVPKSGFDFLDNW